MKIRNGFVSNSSSSSFCIFGMSEGDAIWQAIVARVNQDSEDEIDGSEVAEKILEGQDLLGYWSDSGGNVNIGREWSDVGDDETGRQFKDSIIDKLVELSGLSREDVEKNCGTIEDAWYDG